MAKLTLMKVYNGITWHAMVIQGRIQSFEKGGPMVMRLGVGVRGRGVSSSHPFEVFFRQNT